MSITKEFSEALKAAFGEQHMITGDLIGSEYKHDEFPNGQEYTPDIVCEVASTEEVSVILKLCNEYAVPLTVRGAGTGFVGGSVPLDGGVVLSTKRMNNIIGYDRESMTVRVQPGVLLSDLQTDVASNGYYYPIDPGEKTATIGGNVSTNASGPSAVKYGKTRDYVQDAVIVLADGTITHLSSKEEYAAVIGSEGTLAVITEITLKLLEKVKADAILLFPFMDITTCIKAAHTIMKANFAPAVVEYLDTDLVEFSGKVTGNPVFPVEMDGERIGATLMVTIEGNDDDDVMSKMEILAEMAEELECLDILVGDTPTMKRDFWAAHSAFHTSLESGVKCDCEINIDVPSEKFAEMVEFSKKHGDEQGLKVMAYGHVGSGGLHIHAVSDCSKDDFASVASEFTKAIYAKCAEFNGDIRGEYGIGYAKLIHLKNTLTAEEYKKLCDIKAAFDSKGILNPGKVVETC